MVRMCSIGALCASMLSTACTAIGYQPYGCCFTDIYIPRSYRSATVEEFDINTMQDLGITEGYACNEGLLFVYAHGDGGYQAAVEDALSESGGDFLLDVQSDTKYKSILFGLLVETCTTVRGRAIKLK